MHLATNNSSQPHLPILAVNVSSLWHTSLSARRCIGGTPFSVILSVLDGQRSSQKPVPANGQCPTRVAYAFTTSTTPQFTATETARCRSVRCQSQRRAPTCRSSTDLSLHPVRHMVDRQGLTLAAYFLYRASCFWMSIAPCHFSWWAIKLCWKLISSHQIS